MTDGLDFKSIDLALKAVESDNPNGEFEAILSTPDVDREGETVAPGAFEPLPKSIPVHFSHDFVDKVPPVGRATPFYDGDVLKVRGTFASTPRAQELRSLVNEGVIDSMSAGFLTTKRKGKTVLKGDLIEGSLTATPINRSAAMLRSKALEELEAKAGARHSKSDMERIQAAYDALGALGAVCPACAEAAKAAEPETGEPKKKSVQEAAEEAAAQAAADSAAEEQEALELRARALAMTAAAAAI